MSVMLREVVGVGMTCYHDEWRAVASAIVHGAAWFSVAVAGLIAVGWSA
jgi:hypothetical protein